jgi:hypothetical protein
MHRCWKVLRRAALLAAWAAGAGLGASSPAPLPYRLLVVINDQWKDPASEVIDETSELSMLCALLKTWGLPFDLYRLDQQRFDAYHLLDRTGRPHYGTILWNAPRATLDPEAAALLRSMVTQHGVGLLALSDTATTPVIAELAGLAVAGGYQSPAMLEVHGEHFVTRGIAAAEPPPPNHTKLLRNRWTGAAARTLHGVDVTPAGATVLAQRAGHPALTARQLAGGGRVVWLDVARASAQLYRQRTRDLLKRALVWVNGYLLYAEYPRTVMLSMDDLGSSDKTYYPGWHYQTPSEETIRTTMIEPLQRHRGVVTVNVNTGYVDRRTRRVVNPWRQRVTDELDERIVHDFASTKRALDAGIAAGVIEIQSHGWTHMSPDLDSPPGPFWSAPPRSPVVQLNWYKEFGDFVRKAEVPAIMQRLHLQRGLDGIAEDFGVRAVAMICGGGYGSTSPPHHTARLAATMGFGLAQVENTFYLDHTIAVPLEPVMPRVQWHYNDVLGADEMPWTNDAPTFFGFHDRDVAMDPPSLGRLLDTVVQGARHMTFAEYCAYLHAQVERVTDAPAGRRLRVRYDEHYCGFFRSHASRWVLHLADDASGRAPAGGERRLIEVAPGTGTDIVLP